MPLDGKKKCILKSILNLSLNSNHENDRNNERKIVRNSNAYFFIMRKIHFVCRTLARFDVITQSNAMEFISMLKIS